MMRVRVTAEAADVDVCLTASGDYAPDVMNDLINRARELFDHAAVTLGATAADAIEPSVEHG